MFLALTILLQLSIVLTRNPSFWWRFGKKSAPPPSPFLIGPVFAFLLASTFIAVYWPLDVRPDGGRGDFQGAGSCYVFEMFSNAVHHDFTSLHCIFRI